MSLATALHNYNPTLTKEERELANERRRWLAYERIHKVWEKLKTVRVGYISLNEIAQVASSDWRTVKSALAYSCKQISWQLREAFFELSSYRVAKKIKIISKPLNRKQRSELIETEKKHHKAWQDEINRSKLYSGDGQSIRLTKWQAAAYLQRKNKPSLWQTCKTQVRKLINLKKANFRLDLNPSIANAQSYKKQGKPMTESPSINSNAYLRPGQPSLNPNPPRDRKKDLENHDAVMARMKEPNYGKPVPNHSPIPLNFMELVRQSAEHHNATHDERKCAYFPKNPSNNGFA